MSCPTLYATDCRDERKKKLTVAMALMYALLAVFTLVQASTGGDTRLAANNRNVDVRQKQSHPGWFDNR